MIILVDFGLFVVDWTGRRQYAVLFVVFFPENVGFLREIVLVQIVNLILYLLVVVAVNGAALVVVVVDLDSRPDCTFMSGDMLLEVDKWKRESRYI